MVDPVGPNFTAVGGDVGTVFDQQISCMGNKLFPVRIDMRSATSGTLDFTSAVQQGFIDWISGAYIDNKDGVEDIDFVCEGTQMRFTVRAGRQTFIQFLLGPTARLTWSTVGANNIIMNCYFGNVPFIPFDNVASASAVVETVDARLLGPSVTDFSNTLTGGNDAYVFANEARRYLYIQNPIGNHPVTINLEGIDTTMFGGMILQPGDSYESIDGISSQITFHGTMGERIVIFVGQ